MISMRKDEKRIIRVKISASDGSKFEISAANYEIYLSDSVLKFQEGSECSIEGNVIFILFNPKEAGIYVIKLIMQIGIETVIKKILINVDK